MNREKKEKRENKLSKNYKDIRLNLLYNLTNYAEIVNWGCAMFPYSALLIVRTLQIAAIGYAQVQIHRVHKITHTDLCNR
jgi:hypothetical protein